ncbi:MAG TPA: hypothetical protein PKL83_03210 [bacterium]|nr:hypothetical protein [bacterium]
MAEVDLAREEADDQLDALDACLTDFGQGIDINDRLQQLEAGMRERMTSGEIRMPHQLEARECLRYYEKTVAVQAARQVLELPSVDVQVQLRQAETMVGFIDAIGMPRDIGVLGTDAIEYIVAAVLAADRGQTAERPDAGSNDPIAIGRLVRDLRTTGIYALERFGEQSDWKKKIEELIIFLFAHREQLWPDAERNLQGHIAVLVQQVQTEIAQYSYKQKKPAQYALSDALARAGRVVRQ